MTTTLSLDTYRLLGRSGLRVSPVALGTMTFGTEWGWGSDKKDARRIFDAYVDRGGNFIDTASQYTNGASERFVGEFSENRRDSLVLATKYSMTSRPDDPNAGGNGRKSMMQSVNASLKRLGTDYIDLLYLHAWDFTTPVEEVLRGLDDLVRSGKVLYVAMSDIPAWQVSRMQAIADLRGWSPLVALQIEYSLAQRTVERDLMPMATEMGLGVVAWSPLASGVLTGKYSHADLERSAATSGAEGTRRDIATGSGALNARSLALADTVRTIADETGNTPAQIAIAWTLHNPAVTAPIIGARTLAQLDDNLGALAVILSAEHRTRLEEASAIEPGFPHDFLNAELPRSVIFGNARIRGATA